MCFIDNPSKAEKNIDQLVNILFIVDIFINFISAVEIKDGTFVTRLD